MIPLFNLSGVLPPFVGQNPAERPGCSPYKVELSDVVSRFAVSPERCRLLEGLLELRAALSAIGITQGIQWIDGSFVESVETIKSRPPADIDIVTIAARPTNDRHSWQQLVQGNLDIFVSERSKARFGCDHYFIDTLKRVEILVSDAVYFSNLFSHQRQTSLWKGMIAVPLSSDDSFARALL